jgi:nucleoside 2-deoxyribosyltransferase
MAVCGICGKFRYSHHAELFLQGVRDKDDSRRYKLSHILRTISDGARGIRDNSLFPVYSSNDFEVMLERPDPSVQEKLSSLLKYLSIVSVYPGYKTEFDSANDYSVLCAKNAIEAGFYMSSLYEQGLLAEKPLNTNQGTTFTLSAKGWIELDRIAKSGSESSNAFVAMWFDPSRETFFDAMDKAIRGAGYDSIRIDRVEHINRIDDEIISRIRQSKFIVADFTGQRNGVYFEAGFMLGLGRPVIWICEKSELSKVHFDTRQYNTIDYKDAEDLRTRLQFRIEAILGRGPKKTN